LETGRCWIAVTGAVDLSISSSMRLETKPQVSIVYIMMLPSEHPAAK
jgi:hypothetical protein